VKQPGESEEDYHRRAAEFQAEHARHARELGDSEAAERMEERAQRARERAAQAAATQDEQRAAQKP
jgi:hypothetical protein